MTTSQHYDPDRQHQGEESAATRRSEAGRSYLFIGGFLLVCSLAFLPFVGWDIRDGQWDPMLIAFAADVVAGIGFIIAGVVMRSKAGDLANTHETRD